MKRWIGPIIVLLVLLGAGGYWLYWSMLADGLERGFAKWAEDRRAEGTGVAYASAEVTGFPYRLELHVERPALEAESLNGQPSWSADRLVLYFQTWKRGHGIAQAFGPQKIGWTEGTVRRNTTVTAEQALASFRFTDRGAVTRVDADLSDVTVAGSLPLRRAERLQLHGRTRPEANGAPVFDLSVQGDGLKVDPEASPLGETIDLYRTSITLEPLPDSTSKRDLDAWRDGGGVLQVPAFEVVTGKLSVTGKGTFAVDSERRAEGAATLIVRGAEAFVDAVAAAGQLAGGARLGLQLGITALEETDTEGRKFVRIPIEIQDGRFKLMGIGLARVEPLY